MLQSDHKLFGTMVLIAQNRQLDMLEVFSHPLGPIPWSLANADGTMRKTDKSKLADRLQSTVSVTEKLLQPSACVIDGMALIHKVKGENLTYGELSEAVLKKVIIFGEESERIDLVFDIYSTESIKNAERIRRGASEGITVHEIRDGHKVKNWKALLLNNDSKNKLNKYLVDSWREPSKNSLLRDKTLFVTYGDKCIVIKNGQSQECRVGIVPRRS